MALQYLGRLRGMGAKRWPRIIGEALNEVRDTGTWADYVRGRLGNIANGGEILEKTGC